VCVCVCVCDYNYLDFSSIIKCSVFLSVISNKTSSFSNADNENHKNCCFTGTQEKVKQKIITIEKLEPQKLH